MFRALRIAILITVLVVVAGRQFLSGERVRDWETPLWITIYPVLVDRQAATGRYVESLDAGSFGEIGRFLERQAALHGLRLDTPVVIQVGRPIASLPPELPPGNTGLGVAWWSLKMRWWVWRNSGQDGLAPADIRMFVLYQQSNPNQLLERSVGIQNGLYGLVNAVASRQAAARNRIVITHELLHILGAADKYDLRTGQPLAPDGLANPARIPLYPQTRAEIMGGRIALSPNTWRRPASLASCVIGAATAAEIGW